MGGKSGAEAQAQRISLLTTTQEYQCMIFPTAECSELTAEGFLLLLNGPVGDGRGGG